MNVSTGMKTTGVIGMKSLFSAILILTGLVVPGANKAMADTTIFSDDFSGTTLKPGWQVLAGQGNYALTNGSLRYFNQGPQSSPQPQGWVTTSLALAVPFTGTRWQLDTKATYHLNWHDSSGNSSGAQRPQFIVSFNSASTYSEYVDLDRQIDAAYNANTLSASYCTTAQCQPSVQGLLNPADAAIVNNVAGGTYWYRIIRDGGTLSVSYSYDGVNYKAAFSTALANPSSSYNELLISATTWATVGSYTDWDYVTITAPSPTPTISSLNPNSTVAGGTAFTLTVNGSGFGNDALVQWNGTALPTTFVSDTQLKATVSSSLIAQPGTGTVTISSGGVTSSGVNFAITPAQPAIGSVNPSTIPGGANSQSLVVNGNGFISGSQVKWNSTVLQTTFGSASQLTATVPSSLIAPNVSGVTVSITVVNPGGLTSNAVPVVVKPAPKIISFSPSNAIAGSPDLALTINGTNFVSGGTFVAMYPNGQTQGLPTTLISSTQISVTLPSSLLGTAGTVYAAVQNPDGGGSDQVQFTISPKPAIVSLSPSTYAAGGGGFTLTVTGTAFTTSAVVQWNGTALPTTFLSSTQLAAEVSSNLTAQAVVANITVMISGVTSNAIVFTVTAQKLDITCTPGSGPTTVGSQYTVTCTASGGTPPYRWSISSGTLPAGLSPPTTTGSSAQISGTPTTPGPYSYSVTVSDSAAPATQNATRNFSGTIVAGLTLVTAGLPSGVVGQPYPATTLQAQGGTPPYSWSVTGSPLPLGLTLNPTTGLLSGTPIQAGTFTPTVTVTDSSASPQIKPQPYSITINDVFSISSLNPSRTVSGGPGFTLGIVGTGFTKDTTVQWNGSPLPTSFISAAQLTATVASTLLVQPGTAQVTVSLQGYTAPPVDFTIAPPPSISSLDPNTITAGGPAFTLTVNGSSFSSDMVVQWNGSPLSTTFVSSTRLTASVPAAQIAQSGTANITVALGSITSNRVTLPINAAGKLSVSTTALTFTAVRGGPTPSNQSLQLTSDGNPVHYQVTSSASWLTFSPTSGTTPGTVAVQVNPAGLTGDQYSGTLTITAADAANSPIRVSVNLTLGNAPALTVAPEVLSFSYQTGEATPAAQTVSVFSSGNGIAVPFTASVTGGAWLTVSPASGQTPASLQVQVTPANLAPGTYSGQVTVSAPSATPTSRTISVTLTVTAVQAPSLSLNPTTLSLSAVRGGGPASGTVVVNNTGGGTLSYTAQAVPVSGGAWLQIAGSSSGSATRQAPGTVSLTADPSSLAPGTYEADLVVRAGSGDPGEQRTRVALLVTGQAQSLSLTQTGLEFTATAGGVVSAQSFGVLNAGQGNLAWTAQTTTVSGGDWLQVSPASGSVQGGAVGSLMQVAPNTAGLAPGRYFGTVQIRSDGAANSPQSVLVVLTVLPAGQAPRPQVEPTGLISVVSAGSTTPDVQTVTLRNSGSTAISYTSTVSTDAGGNWLSMTPASGQVSANSSTTVSIRTNPAGLSAGTYQGSIRVVFPDGTVQTITAVMLVAGSSTTTQSVSRKIGPMESRAANCSGKNLAVVFTTPSDGFQTTVGRPVPLKVLVKDSCNNYLYSASDTSVSVQVQDELTKGAYRKLDLKPEGATPATTVWTTTWIPAVPGIPRIMGAVATYGGAGGVVASGNTGDHGMRGTVVAESNGLPQPQRASNSASYTPDAQVAPGTSVTLLGDQLASTTASPDDVRHLPTQLGDAQVLIGETPLRLQYTSPQQINALIPLGVEALGQLQLQVRRGDTPSVPVTVTVADVVPAIYTTSQNGQGQGAILVANSGGVIAAPSGAFPSSRPVRVGEYIEIYCTGLGVVDNPPVEGQPAKAEEPLARTKQTPTVTIGGVPGVVTYSGLGPGLTGIYQVNVQLSPGTPSGSAIPLVLQIGNRVSNTVTVAVE